VAWMRRMSWLTSTTTTTTHLLTMVQGRRIRNWGLLTPRRGGGTVGQATAVLGVLLQHAGHVIVHAAQLRQGHAAAQIRGILVAQGGVNDS